MTKAYIRGSLRQIDRFGQKAAFEGNYKIQINAKPGQAEAMKTDVFTIKHKNVVMGASLNDQAGVSGLRVDNLPAGTYTVKTTGPVANSGVQVTGQYGFGATLHKLTSTTNFAAGVGGADVAGKTLTISLDGTAATTVTFAAADNDLDKVITKINASGGLPEGVTATNDGGKLVLTSTKGVITVAGTAVDGTNAAVGGTLINQNIIETATPITMPDLLTASVTDGALTGNASILYEVVSVNAQAKSVTLKATANILNPDGTVKHTDNYRCHNDN